MTQEDIEYESIKCGVYDQQKEEITRLRAALEWLPIETAPKDGTRIIVGYARQSGFPVKVVFYDNLRRYWSHYGDAELGLEKNATHWTPLPEAPAMQEDKP